MDSHSRSASPREPSRPQHRPPSPPASPAGFDNRAYQHDEADPNHNDSFASQPHQNGHTKELNGDTKTLEAVNLELINLTPKNGNTKKKDVEVDMNATNPYDEYFVPVNEHRKYMRGEKLYVTADKRGEKGGCKRPLCWTLLALVVVAIVAVIVLAATGILFTNSPTPLESYNTSVSSARALGGIGGHVHNHDDHDHDHDHDNHHDHDHDHHDHTTQLPTTQHTPETQNDEGDDHSIMSEESGDMSMYVPKTVEGELRIDNKDFVSALEDPESDEYKEFTSSFSDALKRALFDRNTIDNGDNEISVEVVQIKEGSVIVTYRVHWKPKSTVGPTEDLLTANTLKSSLDQYLERNNRMISVYHVAEDQISTRPVLDICQINNNNCEYGCIFDDATLDFTCTCPHGQIQDMRFPKRCIPVLDNSDQQVNRDDNTEKEYKVLTLDGEDGMRAVPEDEKPDTQTVHMADGESAFDWKETHHMTPEPTTESDSDLNFSHIFGHPRSKSDGIEAEIPQPEPEPTAEPEPEPTAEPKPEPEPTAEPKAEPEPTAEPKPEPEPTAEPKSESDETNKEDSKEMSEPKPEPEPTAQPSVEPEKHIEIKSDTESMEEPKPEPTAEPEPTSEPKPESELTSETETITELKPESINKLSPESDPSAEPEATSEPEHYSEHAPTFVPSKPHTFLESVPTAESRPESEPTAEPKSETQTTIVPKADSESSDVFNSESESKIESGPTFEIKTTTPVPRAMTESETNTRGAEETLEEIKSETEIKPTDQNYLNPSIDTQHTAESSFNEGSEQGTTELTKIEISGSSTEDKFNDIKGFGETTTTRISISEPNVINEPSYEPTPEIISILRENNEKANETQFTSRDDDDDYLSFDNHEVDQQKTSLYTNEKASGEVGTATEVMQNVMREDIGTEQRSSKNLNGEFIFETTTIKDGMMNSEEDVTFEQLKNNREKPMEISTNLSNETPTTIATMNEKIPERLSENNIVATTMSAETISTNELTRNETNDTEKSVETISEIPVVNKEYKDTLVEQDLIQGLENKNESESEINSTTAPSEIHSNNDVTFDAINMLYNRTSKAIEDANTKQTTESASSNDSTESPESDWLSETVTEENYKEAMNKMESHESTEAALTKIDEIISPGSNNDDFEPDYLSNIGSNNNKMSENDEPLYGMVQDYNNDDLRVKKSETKEDKISDSNNTTNGTNNIFESSSVGPTETIPMTTITQYIYKSSEPLVGNDYEADLVKESNKVEISNISSVESVNKTNTTDDVVMIPTTAVATTMISLGESGDTIVATEAPNFQNTTQVNNLNVTIYEISNNSGNLSLATPNHTHPQSAEYEDHETEMNPFLPEAENNKILVKKLQEGHDLDLININETQNENTEDQHINMSSHDVTHSNNIVTSNQTVNNDSNTRVFVTTTTESTRFNELLMSGNSQSNEENSQVTTLEPKTSSPIYEQTTEFNRVKSEEVLPISTFLLDTDDLDIPKRTNSDDVMSRDNTVRNEVTNMPTEAGTTLTPKRETEDDESEYLSVVPIESEKLEEKGALKDFNSENIQALNYISDSPKKSDRRTIDTTNLDSVLNNEA